MVGFVEYKVNTIGEGVSGFVFLDFFGSGEGFSFMGIGGVIVVIFFWRKLVLVWDVGRC